MCRKPWCSCAGNPDVRVHSAWRKVRAHWSLVVYPKHVPNSTRRFKLLLFLLGGLYPPLLCSQRATCVDSRGGRLLSYGAKAVRILIFARSQVWSNQPKAVPFLEGSLLRKGWWGRLNYMLWVFRKISFFDLYSSTIVCNFLNRGMVNYR